MISKKGQTYFDIAIIIILIFGAAFGFIAVNMGLNTINTALLGTEEFNSSTDQGQVINEFDQNFASTYDNVFAIVLIFLWISMIVTAFYVDSNPIFMIIAFVLIVFVLIIAAVLSNTYAVFASNENIYTFASEFPKMNFIMNNLLLICIFIAMSGLIALYGKNNFGGTI